MLKIKRRWMRAFTLVLLSALFLLLAACGEKQPETPASGAQKDGIPLLQQIEQGLLSLDDIKAEESGFGTTGNIFRINVTNESSDVIEVIIPCGMVLQPDDPSMQPMMVIQTASASLSPGETASLSPYVACIDAQSGAPELGAAYHLGSLASADLLAFAECLCQDPETSTDPMGVQFAIWMVSEDSAFTDSEDFSGEAIQSLLADQLGEDLPEDLQGMLDGILSMITGGSSEAWLERCGFK